MAPMRTLFCRGGAHHDKGFAAAAGSADAGRRVLADHAQWSVNPKIVIFCFSPSANPGAQEVAALAACNAQGKPLPAGHNSVGAG
jgi:hypothetical protein